MDIEKESYSAIGCIYRSTALSESILTYYQSKNEDLKPVIVSFSHTLLSAFKLTKNKSLKQLFNFQSKAPILKIRPLSTQYLPKSTCIAILTTLGTIEIYSVSKQKLEYLDKIQLNFSTSTFETYGMEVDSKRTIIAWDGKYEISVTEYYFTKLRFIKVSSFNYFFSGKIKSLYFIPDSQIATLTGDCLWSNQVRFFRVLLSEEDILCSNSRRDFELVFEETNTRKNILSIIFEMNRAIILTENQIILYDIHLNIEIIALPIARTKKGTILRDVYFENNYFFMLEFFEEGTYSSMSKLFHMFLPEIFEKNDFLDKIRIKTISNFKFGGNILQIEPYLLFFSSQFSESFLFKINSDNHPIEIDPTEQEITQNQTHESHSFALKKIAIIENPGKFKSIFCFSDKVFAENLFQNSISELQKGIEPKTITIIEKADFSQVKDLKIVLKNGCYYFVCLFIDELVIWKSFSIFDLNSKVVFKYSFFPTIKLINGFFDRVFVCLESGIFYLDLEDFTLSLKHRLLIENLVEVESFLNFILCLNEENSMKLYQLSNTNEIGLKSQQSFEKQIKKFKINFECIFIHFYLETDIHIFDIHFEKISTVKIHDYLLSDFDVFLTIDHKKQPQTSQIDKDKKIQNFLLWIGYQNGKTEIINLANNKNRSLIYAGKSFVEINSVQISNEFTVFVKSGAESLIAKNSINPIQLRLKLKDHKFLQSFPGQNSMFCYLTKSKLKLVEINLKNESSNTFLAKKIIETKFLIIKIQIYKEEIFILSNDKINTNCIVQCFSMNTYEKISENQISGHLPVCFLVFELKDILFIAISTKLEAESRNCLTFSKVATLSDEFSFQIFESSEVIDNISIDLTYNHLIYTKGYISLEFDELLLKKVKKSKLDLTIEIKKIDSKTNLSGYITDVIFNSPYLIAIVNGFIVNYYSYFRSQHKFQLCGKITSNSRIIKVLFTNSAGEFLCSFQDFSVKFYKLKQCDLLEEYFTIECIGVFQFNEKIVAIDQNCSLFVSFQGSIYKRQSIDEGLFTFIKLLEEYEFKNTKENKKLKIENVFVDCLKRLSIEKIDDFMNRVIKKRLKAFELQNQLEPCLGLFLSFDKF